MEGSPVTPPGTRAVLDTLNTAQLILKTGVCTHFPLREKRRREVKGHLLSTSTPLCQVPKPCYFQAST